MELLIKLVAIVVVGYILVGIYFAMLDWLAEERIRERRELRRKQRLDGTLRKLTPPIAYKK